RDRHWVGVFNGARWLAREVGPDVTVVGDFPRLQPFVRFRYLEERRAVVGYDLGATDAIYLEALRLALQIDGADYALFSERWRGPRPACLATGAGVPPFLVPVHREPGAIVYEVRTAD
ncbi:MAG: hypothetical protein KDB80_02020, partial [Planctomycetes bacterium]|nr:hypothetical protein [Planctomycetota bacterium]